MNYTEFLEKKKKTISESGFDVAENDINPALFIFQRFIVIRALKAGKYAVFADCGLGKTLMQLEWAYQVYKYTNQPVLILAPLAVVGQTVMEGEKFGYSIDQWPYSDYTDTQIMVANYEQLDNIDCSLFAGIALDESSILKNFEGATKEKILELFTNTPYKSAWTATPSPNDPMELGNHSEFLNVMPRNEMLSMYFVHDGGDTAKWRLKGHCQSLFWEWVSSWAIMLTKPADIGFPADGYDLPDLNYLEKQIATPKRHNGQLFNNVAVSATDFNGELRVTKIARLSEVVEIVNNSSETFIVWIKQNEEGEYLKSLISDAIEVKGSDSPEYKKEKLLGFAKNEFRVLITKTKIGAMGLNYQNCHNQIFASLDFGFEALYQGVRRSYRFGQKEAVNIWLITTDTMQNVIQSIYQKQKQFNQMQEQMRLAINKNLNKEKKIRMERKYKEYRADNAILQLGDCVQLVKQIPNESIGFSIFSPPFAELYTYSDELEDMGNSKNYEEFLTAFRFLVKDLYRIMWSGRNVAVHCMDLPIQKGKEGYIGLRDFSGLLLQAFIEEGFIYHSRVTIWKDPVVEMQRTKALGLLHKQVKKDAAMSRVGIPDYLVVFRKPGEHKHPVKCDIPVDLWQKYASPVWYDIDYGKTLNGRAGRDEKDEKHICPLQLETINRATHLWSNAGDWCYTPFGGIGSEPYEWLKMGRKAIAHELKTSYFDLMVKNVKSAELSKSQFQLFVTESA